MSARIMDGKALAKEVLATVGHEVVQLVAQGHRPGLAAILVGDDPGSRIYVQNKRKACEEAGIYSELHHLPATTSQAELLVLVEQLNHNSQIHGILLQLPLPCDPQAVLDAILPEKDVDALHPDNAGRLLRGDPRYLPCTSAGILRLLDHAEVPLEGRHAVVIGRSYLVGKPTALLLLERHVTLTVCHTRTKGLAAVCQDADVLIAAVGRPEVVGPEMVKPGAAVVDVGINRLASGRLVGDVAFEAVRQKAGWISPVPGGVGPMTVAMLLHNTVEAAKRQLEASR